MSQDEEEEGMGTSGEIRRSPEEIRPALEARRGARLWRRLLLRSRLRTSLGTGERTATEQEARALQEATAIREELARASRDLEASAHEAGYTVYGDFIKDELEAQDKRKASFEQRGLAVITTSGTLVTLLFALAALSTKEAATFTLPTTARTWLAFALVLFFASALAALLSNAPFIYQAVPVEKIRERLREKPPRDAHAAAKDVAFSRLDALEAAKKINGIKGWALAAAMACEALAVGCVAVAIGIIL